MPVFTFSGKNETGEKITGERVATNKQALATQLRRERIISIRGSDLVIRNRAALEQMAC